MTKQLLPANDTIVKNLLAEPGDTITLISHDPGRGPWTEKLEKDGQILEVCRGINCATRRNLKELLQVLDFDRRTEKLFVEVEVAP